MSVPPTGTMYSSYAFKRRRTATSTLAGDFDTRPQRDVLTSVLNGVPVYEVVEKAEMEEERRTRRRERKEKEKEREKEKKRAKSISNALERPHIVANPSTSASASTAAPAKRSQPIPVPRATPTTTSSFWQARPVIHIATAARSRSVSPPPMVSSPPTTPGPSHSSATSTTSSKRPHTPDDGDAINDHDSLATLSPQPEQLDRPPRKKRQAARKGWKGWVEGSPPPSEKLINLDVVPLLGERKTRSGKSFDAIGVGKDSWV